MKRTKRKLIEEEVDKGFMSWFNDFQNRNCRGCQSATMGEIGVGELCCEWFYTRIENNLCLDRS